MSLTFSKPGFLFSPAGFPMFLLPTPSQTLAVLPPSIVPADAALVAIANKTPVIVKMEGSRDDDLSVALHRDSCLSGHDRATRT